MNTTTAVSHTPGPWTLKPNVEGRGQDIMADGHTLMRLHHVGPQAEANCRLIAAAPELLTVAIEEEKLATFIDATLRSVAVPSELPEISRAFLDIRQALVIVAGTRRRAIAKAEGRGV